MTTVAKGQRGSAVQLVDWPPNDRVQRLQPVRDPILLMHPLRDTRGLLGRAEEVGDALDRRGLWAQRHVKIKLALLVNATDHLPDWPLPGCVQGLAPVVAYLDGLLWGLPRARTGEHVGVGDLRERQAERDAQDVPLHALSHGGV